MLVKLTQDTINKVFENAESQFDYLFGLYRIAVPDFDRMKKYNGHPEVSKKTCEYIFSKAIEFDKKVHPDVIGGGLWMNVGFSAVKDVPDWHVRVGEDKIIYDEEKK